MQKINGANIKTFARQLSGNVADELLFPKAAMPGISSIEVLGQQEAIVHGCRGITEFDGSEIILRMNDCLLKICGFSLTVKSFSSGCADITGNICSFEFIGGKK